MRDPILEEALSRRGAIKMIADRLGISIAAVSQWQRVPRGRLQAVAEITGIPADQLRPDLTAAQAA